MSDPSTVTPQQFAESLPWHKILAVVMVKFGVRELVIANEDVINAQLENASNIMVHNGSDTITLKLVTDVEAAALIEAQAGVRH